MYIARRQSNLKTVLKTVKDKTQKVVLSLNKNSVGKNLASKDIISINSLGISFYYKLLVLLFLLDKDLRQG